MKYLNYILISILLSSCTGPKCNLGFKEFLNKSFLKHWQENTKSYISKKGDKKLKYLLNSETQLGISMFNREDFIKISDTLINRYGNLKFGTLTIIELNTAGEKNTSNKYIITSCEDSALVIRFKLGADGWGIFSVKNIEREKISILKGLLNSENTNNYFGSGINELASYTEIESNSKINVKVYGFLSREQYEGINELN